MRIKADRMIDRMRPYFNGTFYFYLTLLACYSILWIIFVREIGIQTASWSGDLIHTLGDMMIIMLPYWFFGRKLRLLPLICLWLFSFLLLSNIWYFRFWSDVLSPISVSMVGNLNEELTDSVNMLWQPGDYIYLLFPFIASVSYFVFRPVNVRYSCKFRVLAVGLAVVVFLVGRFYDSSASDTIINREYANVDSRASGLSKEVHKMKRGPVLYTIHSIKNFRYWLKFEKTLSHAEVSRIDEFIRRRPLCVDSVFEQNKDKNLVIIVVESLNGTVIGRNVNGVAVTPNLDRMIAENGAIY